MNDAILAGLYRKHADLAESFDRTRHHEQIAFRSVNGGVYPTGSPGQALFDFSIGTMFFWDGSAWAAITPGAPWVALALNTGGNWANFGSGNYDAAYRIIGDLVLLRGLVARSSGADNTILTLPSGARPTTTARFGQATSGGFGQIDVLSTGAVIAATGGVAYVSLDGITFSTL